MAILGSAQNSFALPHGVLKPRSYRAEQHDHNNMVVRKWS
ncbi:hypothetical protein YPPY13_3802 [Yersinia pestis PY-13]|nr:hypothetical protein YPPY13_3802 [Yersinia pestis PY-13]EIS40586.1 hypothetical protein YPPY60_3791 [Yersinia pestis PY-60]